MTAASHAQRKQERRAADLARKTAQRQQRKTKEGDMGTAREIAAYLEDHGGHYDLTNSASIEALAVDLQQVLHGSEMAGLQRIRQFADTLLEEVDPNYKDQWETGVDFGIRRAGQRLAYVLDAIGVPT